MDILGALRRGGVALGELMVYQRRDDLERRGAVGELTELGQELGELWADAFRHRLRCQRAVWQRARCVPDPPVDAGESG